MYARVVSRSRLGRVATLVDQLAASVVPDRLPSAEADAARAQIAAMVASLAGRKDAEALALASALRRLSNRLLQVNGRRRARQADKARNGRLLRALRRVALIITAGAAVSAPMAAAAHTTSALFVAIAPASVGDTIIHPVTGAALTVLEVLPNGVIVTGDIFILTTTVVGATLPDPDNPALTVEIASVTVNAGTTLIESVTFTDARTLAVATPLAAAPGAPPGGTILVPAGAGDSNFVQDVRRGSGGGGGRDGALFVSARSGGNGGTGPSFGVTVGGGHPNITTVSPGLPGIIVASIGGNGGNGGDGYLGASGASGGNGGAGGNVSLTNFAGSISTTGAQAHGIVVQSRSGIGGQGGSGFAFSSGGSGGAGNNGGNATVTNHGAITTFGVASHGVFAQSLGGGAGSGGGSYGIFGNGGAGNTGGSGGTATATNFGQVTTVGANSYGVSAQSVGGIGGDAGAAVGLVAFTSDGAAGGNGGTAIVNARTGSQVETRGSGSYGLFAQSIGGGGGNGGLNIGLVSLGAGGGTGGNGGAAQILAEDGSFVTTLGQSAHGMFAQSIGGGGGNGGIGGGIVAFGSRGSSGGTGGAVTVTSGATVSTSGIDARGLFAQSIGGGGGSALGSGGLVALGGSGGGAGGAGTVTVLTTAASNITTMGQGADGIFAQSVGGGGGSGSSTGGVVALGGGGGAGGNGNRVIVTNGGTIITAGDYARGIFAQSVGGGGGSGGDSGGLATIGGQGAGASTGGDVTVTNAGAITTGGNLASAIQIQSIGGGGGDGGSTGGVFLTIGGGAGGGGGSGVVTVINSNNLITTGDDSHGIFAQSVGGGGGSGGSTVSISAFAGAAIGGSAGSGGNGGLVDVDFSDRTVMVGGAPQLVSPLIRTSGDRSRGVYAQSVGGGGGNGGFAAQVSVGYGIGASIAIGGSGGLGGMGGDVNLDGDATIITEGDYSQGIFAQSVGGGGGNGGFATAFSFAAGETAAAAFSVAVGGSGGTGGRAGGLVRVNSGGGIQTFGDFSTGFLTQSVGGGGGNGGFSVSFAGSGAGVASASAAVGVGGSGGSGGVGGTVDALFDGTILTTGDDSRAALIQSVGGGGGNGGFNIAGAVSISGTVGVAAAVGVGGAAGDGGTGGTVTGRVGGAVQTSGDRSTGVTIQSVGGGGGSGGFNISGSIGGGGAVGGAVSVGIGGAGGGGGAGGDVIGSAGSTILTSGNQSGGLVVQSVGGGGGDGGFNVAGSIGGAGTVGAALSVGVGGAGGGGGAGGTVLGRAEGLVRTSGDQSTGVTVQSIGGGGGSGAFNVSGSIGGGGTVGVGLSVGVGGAGGGGGNGGAVTASAVGIITSGDQSGGFLAQSVGGGGGNGGFDITGSIGGGGTVGAGVSVGIGGSGGGGGLGGAVQATVAGDVTTAGDEADAIVVQSVGGGGGNGGFTVAGSIGAGGGAAGAVSVGVGGSGGLGGGSGRGTLSFTGAVRTSGLNSDGIVVQSIGGGGGNGGFAVAGNIAGAGGGAGTVGIGVGGFGGGGGNAGGATLRVNTGVADLGNALLAAHTTGDGARAILVQSLGGGGGNGAFAVTGGISGAKGVAGNVGVGIGGGGGGGGDGGMVLADINGDVLTTGHDATGVFAQSLGGGGGNGGFSVAGGISGSKGGAGNLMIGVGGFGGGGGDGGYVSGVLTSDVTTLGDRSTAVTYQSVGGGGGNGGFTVSGGIAGSAGGSGSVSLGVGGGGGDGGDGGGVNLDITGLIQTAGASSDGVVAQSVGGGGGNGAFAITGNVAFSAGGAGTLGVGIGGMGGGGGDAGAVTLRLNQGLGDPDNTLIAALTLGDSARAIVAQSIGGGGGNGGFAITGGLSVAKGAAGNLGVGVGGGGGDGGDSGNVDGEITGDVRTAGDDASAVLVQSVGGGGGNGGFNITGGITGAKAAAGNLMVGVGGFGGSGGNSGDVTGGVEGDILTLGDRAFGMTYQSLGGGGGNGAFNITGGISLSIAGGAGNLGVGVGGFGGDGGDAGAVNAYLTGDIDTSGRESYGALLQSVGGGGGNGGFNITGGLSASKGGSGTLGFGLGGFGGGGGNAGNVTGVLTGNVTTAGDESFGAMLQSLGGSGGNGGLNVTGVMAFAVNNSAAVSIGIGIGGFAGGGGNAGDVDATVIGQYATSGVNSDAVIAQSLGGGGGNGGLNVTGAVSLSTGAAGTGSIGIGGFGGVGGNAGQVSLIRTGDTHTNGLNSDGVMAQSVGGGGGAGGINISGGLSGSSGGSAGSLGFGLGGFGGGGGDAGDVTAVVTGNVHARGAGPVLVVDAELRTTALPDAIAGIVNQIVPGTFETIDRPAYQSIADGSHGVVAQSIGGGGGSGGLNVTGQVSLVVPGGSHASRSVSIGVGGFGGSGGDAGNVNLTVQAPGPDRVQVSAIGDNRSAVIAQSVGGGGGAGGINISGGVAMDGVLTIGVGGFGGGGGIGRAVMADVDADLFATGRGSRGMMIQSIGGGGGAGAINISGGFSADSTGTEPSLTFGLGGFGGSGNISGNVTANHNGQIMVRGFESIGLLAQSVAGGGGSGGLNVSADVHLGTGSSRAHGVAIGVGVGGEGGDGADAGDVAVDSIGNIFINAQPVVGALSGADAWESVEFAGNSVGLLAQSIGGGGGVGGISITGVVAPSGQPAAIGVGGSGGSGGHGGKVDVVRGYATSGGVATPTSGLIRTFGDNSDGLVAQSIGGGGGRAGMNFTFALTKGNASNNAMAALITVGGSGAGAGSGDEVSVRHFGDIVTAGANSAGLVAQSVGGGGGDANFNIGFGILKNATALNLAVGGDVGAGGSGGDVTVNHVGTIVTSGRAANGVRAQSIGGGGGNTSLDMAVGILATNSLSVTVGRQGGTGGTGGNVNVDVDGIIDTTGDDSTAVFAQSIGGGGGASSATVVGASTTRNPNTADAASYSGSVSVGLDGGIGATGGDVTVVAGGIVTTRGDDARGIHAQSIGGGGGTGGSAGNVIFRAAGAATVSVGGAGGVGAVSGQVDVDNAATIVTLGDRSDGILAQSIGGGGGLAGSARTIAIQIGGAPQGSTTRTASVNVGGTGGTGAVGNRVDVTNTGIIATQGELSFGIRAQSIGGGGGVGGAAINFRAQGTRSNDSFDVNVGGSGGVGGAGGAVSVLNEGLIYTQGRAAAGISANSIGGGGGDAGIVLDVVAGGTGADQQSHRVVLNFGGSGGTGGAGGEVTVTNRTLGPITTGQIVTTGADAYGIFAQSLGGGGGNGSSVISLTGLRSGSDSFIAGLTVGGAGGSGNTGGLVTVNNDGLIDTLGAGAHGILAQSIGGGGGNGGLAITAAGLIGAATNTPLITIGGVGGDGADSGLVTVSNLGRIITRGANAHGIVAQSIGGGGGNAQMGFSLGGELATLGLSTAISALVGGVGGGSGGTGGQVVVNHAGDITVLGDGSMAIKAESINGGGGTLTLDFSGITGLPGVPFINIHGATITPDPLVAARAGAEGSSDMNGGSVTVNTTGTFGVLGANGVGSFNQAIGGGGGSLIIQAVLANPGSLAPGETAAPIGFDVDLGGIDGQNNNGGDIASVHTGDIVTIGQNTPGALFQSVGGGGGRAVIDITAPQGTLLGPIDVSLGGVNGLNESGGDVTLTHSGSLITTARFAPGAIVQSIGGGGGSVSIILRDGAPAPASAPADAIAPAAHVGPMAIPVLVSFGANGGAGLHGGVINAVFGGDVVTQGDSAIGLILQSIGAGGGEARLSGTAEPDITLGGFNGASGNGRAINLANTGQVFTSGERAHGIVLQSIGGGGGAVFGNFTAPTVTLNADNTGDGGAITFSQTGDITVLGTGSYGVIAQSLGGGGGWVDGFFAGTAGGAGRGGIIDLALNGQVFAAGDGGIAVFAQSLGGSGGGDITLVSDGLIRGGAGSGAGVVFDGGDQNLIQTSGSISAVSGWAIRASTGDDRVENAGLVIGNIDLGGGDNVFRNASDGVFIAFDTITLRDQPAGQGVFINDGDFLMGLGAPAFPLDLAAGDVFGNLDGSGDPAANLIYGARVINTVELDGDFVQTASGRLEFDVAFGPYASDRVNVTGDATVDGNGDITLIWLENAQEVTLFATGGTGVDQGLEISDTIALDYNIRADGAGVHLGFVSDFGQDFLNQNGQALGGSIDSALLAGGSAGIGRLSALLGNLRAGQEDIYSAIFTELDPQPHIAPLQLQFASANSFSNELFGCSNVVAQSGDQCVWARIERASRDSGADFEHFGVVNHGVRLRAGFEQPASGLWSVAATVGYDYIEHMRIDELRAFSDGQALNLGLGLRRTGTTGLETGLSLTGGWQWVDTERGMNIFGPAVGESSPESGYVQLSGHVAQLARRGAFFVRPAINASVTALHGAGFTEQGLEGLGVVRLADTQYLATLNPELQMGVVFAETPGAQGVLSFTVGGLFHSEDRIESPFRLVGANPASDPAVIGTGLDREALRLGADFAIAGDNGVSLRLRYSGEFGDRTDSHSAGFDMRFKF